ncbi:hypothetical protein bas36_0221 [Escherichia phage Paracelsus]|nr:hypothetical protein bas36_0221 [Escherichia phage Paracelsus]
MSLSKEQKDKLFELIHELLDEHTEANTFYDEYGRYLPISKKNLLIGLIRKKTN